MNTLTSALADTLQAQEIVLVAKDGYRLSALRYPAQGDVVGNLIVAGATGVQQRLYRRFAEYAARRGFNVLTLDYRGVGGSRPASLKGFQMRYLDWGQLDLAAAVDYLKEDPLPLYWVGHSFGGHAIGLLPNHHALTACYTVGAGAGWSGWMSKSEGLKIRLMWTFVLPVIVKWKGYMAWSLLGMGDDLPLGVYKDWKRWCTRPNYFFDDPAMAHLVQQYAEVKTPCVFATSVDDPWAPPRSRDAFARFFSHAPRTILDLQPPPGSPPIGHMGYFRETTAPLWDDILSWLRQGHLQPPRESQE